MHVDDIIAKGSRKQTRLFWAAMAAKYPLKIWEEVGCAYGKLCWKDAHRMERVKGYGTSAVLPRRAMENTMTNICNCDNSIQEP